MLVFGAQPLSILSFYPIRAVLSARVVGTSSPAEGDAKPVGRLLAGRIVVQEQEQVGSNSSFFAVKNPQIATTVASLSTLTTQRSRRGVRRWRLRHGRRNSHSQGVQGLVLSCENEWISWPCPVCGSIPHCTAGLSAATMSTNALYYRTSYFWLAQPEFVGSK
jgi:hypothetical protein